MFGKHSTYAGFIRGEDGLDAIIGNARPLRDFAGLDLRIEEARGDTYDSEFVDEALTRVTRNTYNRVYQPHPFLSLVNIDDTDGPGLASHKYFEGDAKARWARAGDASADLPTNTETKKKPIIQPVEMYWSGYEVLLKELERYQRSGSDAIPKKARAVVVGYLDLLVLHTLVGDPEAGIDGLANTDRISNRERVTNSNRLTRDSTASQLVQWLIDAAHSIADDSASIYAAMGMGGGYGLLIPASMKRKCDSTFFGIESSENSVTRRFEVATGFTLVGLQRLESIPKQLVGDSTSGTDTTSVAIAGSFSPETHAKIHPVPYREMDPYVSNAGFKTVTPARCDLGGIEIYAPNAFAVRTNPWSNTSAS